MSNKAVQARSLLNLFSKAKLTCPHHDHSPAAGHGGLIRHHHDDGGCEYAFEMISSTIRFGRGVTAELAHDVKNLKAKRPLVITDKNVAKTRAFVEVASSLQRNNVSYDVFDDVLCEPSDASMLKAINFARSSQFDCFIAVGGGSVIDTCKAAALFASNPEADFLDFVQPPFGKGKLPENVMKPLIAVPTTAGTGSETTAVSIFDLPDRECKAGIRLRAIKPLLAVIDPLNVLSMPRNVAIYSGFDVLCHALESYTAKPYYERQPRPATPMDRPVYQGSNPISDVWVREALRIIRKYFRRSIFDPEDVEARTEMLKASSFAGMGFGNAGVHLCHGLSYPISSQGKRYTDPCYAQNHPLIPHGLSVVTTAPADFLFTTDAYPQRHLEAAQLLGADLNDNASPDLIAKKLADEIRGYMKDFGCPNGLKALGFDRGDVDKLADRATGSLKKGGIAPKDPDTDSLAKIYESSLECY
ncbi:unnamed protein product [Bursaphelenchus xylophilus]|uniref:hydroxyacid-oxoacid transhydrogenase n=1 Tax=Bursaphelenchus xylophilus TaxID=6326 RepID=A0A1I7S6D8_BURXY|nr:unnamed protein product [Bursaphelenchus xylophilus]CAG9128098.1 unnamed protein product [Bursaphelenchus xylophilus]